MRLSRAILSLHTPASDELATVLETGRQLQWTLITVVCSSICENEISASLLFLWWWWWWWWSIYTRRPASADRTARGQFQATGQPLSRTQASDAMTSRLPRYEAKCVQPRPSWIKTAMVQRRCFQCGSVPLRSDIKGTELPPANILIPVERQLIALQLCCWQFLYNETLQQTFRHLLSKLSKRRQI